MKLVHLTDTHTVRPGRVLHGLDPLRNLEACVASIAERHGDAAFCVLTGDVADHGDPAAYEATQAILSALPMPVHVLPGNHDDRAALIAGFPDVPRDAHGFVQAAFTVDGATFVFLDTLDSPSGSSGAVCERRARWLGERLAEAGTDPVYLFMHHPPFPVGLPGLDCLALVDPRPFEEAVRGAGNVRHIFFGHVHRPISGQWRGISFSSTFGTSHQIRLDLDYAERLVYTAEPPAYCVVLLDGESVLVHTCHFLADERDIRDG